LFGAVSGLTADHNIIRLMQRVSISAWALAGLILLIFLLRNAVLSRRLVTSGPTWGCGYDIASPKLQYTASSFVGAYSKIIKPVVEIRKTDVTICDIVPGPIHSESHFHDKLETGLIDRPTRSLRGFLGRFKFLQNGSVQFYVLYGVVFIAISILIPMIIDALRSLFLILKQL
jgi:hydrogenase-4 component B